MAEPGTSVVRSVPAVFIRTLGCKVNRAESEQAAASLLARGVRLVDEDEAAVVVINTCTVTGEADRKARKAVRHAHALPHEPVVVVTGCLAALDAGGLSALGERVVVEADRERLAERVAELLGAAREVDRPAVRTGEGFRARVAIKVEDGCDAFCAYCIVPYARGVPRSVPLPGVVGEVESLVRAGTREVVLSGINIGRYRWEEAGLTQLVEAVAATGVARLRISSIEPLDLTEELLAVFAHAPSLCDHLHVPLQSGSDRVLDAMSRGYTVAEYRERIAQLRRALPDVAVTTDVMVGFPGESAEDAEHTRALVAELGFSRLHVFRYSRRQGTAAAEMCGQVDAAEIARRASVLRADDARLRAAHAASRVGQRAEVLVEEVSRGRQGMRATGTTRDYLRVTLDGEGVQPGELVGVTLVSAEGDRLLGTRAGARREGRA